MFNKYIIMLVILAVYFTKDLIQKHLTYFPFLQKLVVTILKLKDFSMFFRFCEKRKKEISLLGKM